MQINYIISLSVLLMFMSSCFNQSDDAEIPIPYSEIKHLYKDQLMEYNRNLTQTDKVIIENFIERRRWDMERSETGLFYQIYEQGGGKQVEVGKYVEFEYTTSLLNGNVLYDSETYGTRTLLIGRNTEERGLDEGLRLLSVGDKARFILHPFLAFGVLGDGYKVPHQAILLYDIEVVDVRSNK